MAAKKKNVYSKESVQELKASIDDIVDYLETIDPETLKDDIDWKVTLKGPIPTIVCTIEENFKTALITIKDCSSMLLVIADLDKDLDYIESRANKLRGKLNDISSYYKLRPISIIQHRRTFQSIPGKATKKNPSPTASTREFLVATKQRQIADRAMITKRILETLPLLEKLEETVEALDVRGDYDLPVSFKIRGIV